MRDGAVSSLRPSMLVMVFARVESSPVLFNVYMDELSVELSSCKTGCVIGTSVVNHLMYADDLVLLSPYSAGMQELLRICSWYGRDHDVLFNSNKSNIMIVRNKNDKDVDFLVFRLCDRPLNQTK